MKTYWDTSGLIRAYVLKTKPKGITRAHRLAEFFSVLSGPGLAVLEQGKVVKKALSPQTAAKAIQETFSELEFFDLNGQQVLESVCSSTKASHIIGPKIHDWLHCQTAEKCGAERIMTLNSKDFRPMTKLPLEVPSSAS